MKKIISTLRIYMAPEKIDEMVRLAIIEKRNISSVRKPMK